MFTIEAKGDKVMISAPDTFHAFAKYFYDIINEKVTLDKIGAIILLKGKRKDGGDDIPFRTVPILWKMGVMGTKFAVDSIVDTLHVSRKEAKRLLKEAGDSDAARLVPLIDDLRLAEEKG